jgi:hypothetical protein
MVCLIRRISFDFFDFFYVISILFGPSIKILPILPTVFFWHKQNLPIAQKTLVAPLTQTQTHYPKLTKPKRFGLGACLNIK